MDELRKLLQDTRQWIEQERVWDEALYATHGDWETGRRGDWEKESRTPPVPPSPCLPVAPSQKAAALQALYERYKDCTRCPLGNTRIRFVFGVGNAEAEVMLIGEGPGYEEDRRGEPFVGPAGQLLDKMLAAIGLSRPVVYITNIVKCHAMVNPETPEARRNDRPPNALEVETCSPILQEQIAIIEPKMIMTLGSPASKAILQTTEGITKIRGRFFPLPGNPSIRVLPTFHPAALLRFPELKQEAWQDLKLLRDSLQNKLT